METWALGLGGERHPSSPPPVDPGPHPRTRGALREAARVESARREREARAEARREAERREFAEAISERSGVVSIHREGGISRIQVQVPKIRGEEIFVGGLLGAGVGLFCLLMLAFCLLMLAVFEPEWHWYLVGWALGAAPTAIFVTWLNRRPHVLDLGEGRFAHHRGSPRRPRIAGPISELEICHHRLGGGLRSVGFGGGGRPEEHVSPLSDQEAQEILPELISFGCEPRAFD